MEASNSTSPTRDVRPATPLRSNSLPEHHHLAAGSAHNISHQQQQQQEQGLGSNVHDFCWNHITHNPHISPARSMSSSSTLSSYQSIDSHGEFVPHRQYSPDPTPAGPGTLPLAPAPDTVAASPSASPKRKCAEESPENTPKKPKLTPYGIEAPTSPPTGADRITSGSEHPLSTITTQVSEDVPIMARAKPRTKRVPTVPAIATRPSRVRKAPERLGEEAISTVKTSPAPKTGVRGSKVFDPTYITTNSNSRLAKAKTDVYHLLLEPSAWDSLSPDQQFTLTKMLPRTKENRTLLATQLRDESAPIPRPKELTACDLLRTDVAKFQSDLRNGYLAKGWQVSAHQAMKDRANGVFDDWKERETEAWWGQKANPF